MNSIFLFPIFIILIVIALWYIYDTRGRKKMIVNMSKLDALAIVDQQKDLKSDSDSKDEDKELSFKLIQAGLTKKEYNEGRLAIALIGIILGVFLPSMFGLGIVGIVGIFIGLTLVIFGGKLYIYISKTERAEKIDNDLGVFLDLINVILEAGGGLKNAFFTVSTRAHGILNEELLKEIAILEYEMTNYSTKKSL